MGSVYDTLKKLSGHTQFEARTSNRYALVTRKNRNIETAYYFSSPIFNHSTGKIVEPTFTLQDQYYRYEGSSGTVKICGEHIVLIHKQEEIRLLWEKKQNFILSPNSSSLRSDDMIIFPTCNGIAIKCKLSDSPKTTVFLQTMNHYAVQTNSKYFALMKSKFEPLVTLSAMFAENRYRDFFSGITLNAQKQTDDSYKLELLATNPQSCQLIYEINLYETKLIQDTTVESYRPNENNAYGSISFLGRSPHCGKQILYTKIDDSKIETLPDYKINTAKLHIPYYTVSGNAFLLSVPTSRFCSFGSTWKNKISFSRATLEGTQTNGFITFNVSPYVLTPKGEWKTNVGFVVQSKSDHFSIIATGDNYYTPQILEIQYSKKEGEKL